MKKTKRPIQLKKTKNSTPTDYTDIFITGCDWNVEKGEIMSKKMNLADIFIFLLMILAIVTAACLHKAPVDRELLKKMAGNYYLVDKLLDEHQ